MYLFNFGCAGSLLLCAGFSSCVKQGPLFLRGAGFSFWWPLVSEHGLQGAWVSIVVACRLSSCGTGDVESSGTRHWTHVPCAGKQTLKPPDPQGSPLNCILKHTGSREMWLCGEDKTTAWRARTQVGQGVLWREKKKSRYKRPYYMQKPTCAVGTKREIHTHTTNKWKWFLIIDGWGEWDFSEFTFCNFYFRAIQILDLF